ncbi:hypothetical protein GMMP15_680016 [Candidatus Magnetomoraceae bacterium gMMP-15]
MRLSGYLTIKDVKRVSSKYVQENMYMLSYPNEKVRTSLSRHLFSAYSKINRSVLWEGEKKWQNFKTYVPTIDWQALTYATSRKNPAVVGHQRIGRLKNPGRVKVVFSSLVADGSEKWAAFCTNYTNLPMVTVVSCFEKRWKIEVFFKESRSGSFKNKINASSFNIFWKNQRRIKTLILMSYVRH